MNYITRILIEIYKKRFAHDKPYLSEKLEELETHKNKYDGLNFLCTKADETTLKMYEEKTDLTAQEIEFLRSVWYKI